MGGFTIRQHRVVDDFMDRYDSVLCGVAWFIMEVIDYYVVLPARTAFAIWVGLSWLLVWQVGARIAAHERRRFGLKTR